MVADNLRHPWSVAFLPGGGFLVTEKEGGLVRIARDRRKTSIEGMPDDLDSRRLDRGDNSGLFDIALHPDFSRNGYLFLTYAARRGDGTTTRLVRAKLVEDRLVEIRALFEARPFSPDRFHYGGALLVANGHLYLSVGERHYNESANPILPAAQDPTDLRGKIYRFDLRGRPAGAGTDRDAGHPAMFASGIRATQGMALDARFGEIWFTDHGPTGGDELNRLVVGANYGWPVRTSGKYRNVGYVPGRTLPGASYVEPVHVFADRTVAPTGLTFVSGAAYAAWKGDLLVGGLSRGHLVRVDLEGGRVVGVDYLMANRAPRIRNVRQSPDGRIYAVTDEANGRLLLLEPTRRD